ncbi:MAG: helix-turn-helix domain-containing protein [Caldilineaceae bacterium]|nr:helix-turn-helix domain-containing protein [Caldilineaceae bacterium]
MNETPADTGAAACQAPRNCDTADTRNPARPSPETVHRTLWYRLFPGTVANGNTPAGIAGVCRHVWNWMLADCECRYELWRAYRIGPAPSVCFVTLCQRFTDLCNNPNHACIRNGPGASR